MAKSIKGKEVNFEALMLANPNAIALGNANMNARGDLLGKGGKVIKTREELALEYNTNVPNKAVSAPVSQPVVPVSKTTSKKKTDE